MNKIVHSYLLKIESEVTRYITTGLPLKRPVIMYQLDKLLWLLGQSRVGMCIPISAKRLSVEK